MRNGALRRPCKACQYCVKTRDDLEYRHSSIAVILIVNTCANCEKPTHRPRFCTDRCQSAFWARERRAKQLGADMPPSRDVQAKLKEQREESQAAADTPDPGGIVIDDMAIYKLITRGYLPPARLADPVDGRPLWDIYGIAKLLGIDTLELAQTVAMNGPKFLEEQGIPSSWGML